MRRFVYAISLVLLSIYVTGSHAVDMNGYTAQYECRAGGPHCNVDVISLGKRACDQTITPSDPWSKISWSNNTICLQAGDHTGKGTLTVPAWANGNAGNYKVLRYHRPGDIDDEPWRQSSVNQARISRLVIEGDYWLVHRLTFPGRSGNQATRIEFQADASNDVQDIIINRVLIEGIGAGSHFWGIATNGDRSQNYQGLSIQNSVLRNVGPYAREWEAVSISLHVGDSRRNSRFYIVNNEIYDYVSHPIQIGRNQRPTIPGIVVENNDLYITPTLHTADGRAKTESLLSVKVKGTPEHPTRIIHNRIWGARPTDLNYCCNGEAGNAIANYQDQSYLLVQNNIIGESQIGSYPSDRSSWIGNIFYKIKRYYNGGLQYNSHVLQWGGNAVEVYLNTIVDNPNNSSFSFGGQSMGDVRCNVLLSASGREGGSTSSSFQVDYNTFYDSPKITANGGDNNIIKAVTTRQNSTAYRVGDIIRTGPIESCTTENNSNCFLYQVTVAGTSAASSPAYCTTPNCAMADGTMTAVAIRGPYSFYRKLRTSPERYTIPYALPYTQSPEAHSCPLDFGSRPGIGVSDDLN